MIISYQVLTNMKHEEVKTIYSQPKPNQCEQGRPPVGGRRGHFRHIHFTGHPINKITGARCSSGALESLLRGQSNSRLRNNFSPR